MLIWVRSTCLFTNTWKMVSVEGIYRTRAMFLSLMSQHVFFSGTGGEPSSRQWRVDNLPEDPSDLVFFSARAARDEDECSSLPPKNSASWKLRIWEAMCFFVFLMKCCWYDFVVHVLWSFFVSKDVPPFLIYIIYVIYDLGEVTQNRRFGMPRRLFVRQQR